MSFINPPNFKKAMAGLASTIDETFGEMLRITPCSVSTQGVNYPAEMHADQAINVRGVFTTRSELVMHNSSVSYRGAPSGLVETRTPIFSFARAQLPWGLQRHDQIARLCNDEIYEVTHIESDVTSQRIVVHVVQLRRMEQ